MRILGIDPGLSTTGYGIIDVNGQALQCVDFGGISFSRKLSLAEKLDRLFTRLTACIQQFEPAICAIEDVFYHENVNTAIVMGHARGVAMVAAQRSGLEVFEYTPREVKMSIAGNGAASKQQIQCMVQRLLRLAEPPRPADAADALAVALCHYHRARFQALTRNYPS